MDRIEQFAQAFPDLEITDPIADWIVLYPREAWVMTQLPDSVAVKHGISWLKRHGRLPKALIPYLWFRANREEGIKCREVSAFHTIQEIILEAAQLNEER